VDGIFNTMKEMDIWQGDVNDVRKPIVADESESVVFFNAPKSGIFLPSAKHWKMLEVGDEVGCIINPLEGEVLCRIVAKDRGILFTIREYPVVDEGSLIGRLLKV
jgi:hypothetical protein